MDLGLKNVSEGRIIHLSTTEVENVFVLYLLAPEILKKLFNVHSRAYSSPNWEFAEIHVKKEWMLQVHALSAGETQRNQSERRQPKLYYARKKNSVMHSQTNHQYTIPIYSIFAMRLLVESASARTPTEERWS